MSCASDQAVSRQFLTVETRVESRVIYVGFVGDKVAFAQILLPTVWCFPVSMHYT